MLYKLVYFSLRFKIDRWQDLPRKRVCHKVLSLLVFMVFDKIKTHSQPDWQRTMYCFFPQQHDRVWCQKLFSHLLRPLFVHCFDSVCCSAHMKGEQNENSAGNVLTKEQIMMSTRQMHEITPQPEYNSWMYDFILFTHNTFGWTLLCEIIAKRSSLLHTHRRGGKWKSCVFMWRLRH